MERISVRKIGGENAAQPDEVLSIAHEVVKSGENTTLVLSGPRTPEFNTTSHINAAAQHVMNGDMQKALKETAEVEAFMSDLVSDRVAPRHHPAIHGNIKTLSDQLRQALQSGPIRAVGTDFRALNQSITAFGERFGEAFYSHLFTAKGIPHLRFDLQENPNTTNELDKYTGGLAFTGGYLAKLATSRGYSDATAAFIARHFQDRAGEVDLTINKQTSLHTADPRQLNGTLPISVMGFDVAEAVSEKNGVVHPRVFDILRESTVNIRILGSDKTQTLITPNADVPKGTPQTIHVDGLDSDTTQLSILGPDMIGSIGTTVAAYLRAFGVSIIDQTSDNSHSIGFETRGLTLSAIQGFHDRLFLNAQA